MATLDPIEAERLRDLARLLIGAWNQGDARAFAGLFTSDAEYVTGSGERVRGRTAISRLVEPAPRAQVRSVGDASVEFEAGTGRLTFAWSMPPDLGGRRGRISCTCRRHESGWLIEALQNVEDGPIA
jgi:hypothetical protein